jgi:hypothetical protein
VIYSTVLPDGTPPMSHRIDLDEFVDGSYILQVMTGTNIKTEKLIINNQ